MANSKKDLKANEDARYYYDEQYFSEPENDYAEPDYSDIEGVLPDYSDMETYEVLLNDEQDRDNNSVEKMSPAQIKKMSEETVAWNEAQTKKLTDNPPQSYNPNDKEEKEFLDNMANASNNFNKTLSENAKDIAREPERAAEIGKTLANNVVNLGKNFKDIRLSNTKEEFIKNTDKLTRYYNYIENVLHKHKRKANEKNKIFTDAINKQETLIKTYQRNLKELYPKEIQDIEKDIEDLKMEKNILYASMILEVNEDKKRSLKKN